MWIDTHCHLDAPEFAADAAQVRAQARAQGVALCVIPAVQVSTLDDARQTAHCFGDAYALGIHPLYVAQAHEDALAQLAQALDRHAGDPRLVAVGEIGLDGFVPALTAPPLWERQQWFFRQQLKLARQHGLPVILHVRRAVDAVLKGLREMGAVGGVAHAFNGSAQQAHMLLDMGFKLGFGGAATYARATRLRTLAATLPLHALVLETDAPDIPPHWLYAPAGQRAAGQPQGRNTPGELPRIAAELAALRGLPLPVLAQAAHANSLAALPRLAALCPRALDAPDAPAMPDDGMA
ncbi:MAG: TatD family hydrolase [Pseudomonadota bacterium]|nr:TatD family hydrolase [Pseudomonadota bacterium]